MTHEPPHDPYDVVHRLDRPTPSMVWGLVMAVALLAAGIAAFRGGGHGAPGADASALEVARLEREVRRIAAERDDLSRRMATLERGVGELKIAAIAQRPSGATGSISTGAGAFALSLGVEMSAEAARRRWSALGARYPRTLSGLAAKVARRPGGALELLAGPFATAEAAARACAELAAPATPCDPVPFTGEPLERL
ncbi:SPOR domain-containing protein [Methylopila musalis]|uniref:SPOR domain-containing protein n=1 Tax=Methylopila musalis TaxID=1134781 RepID=A0ABW3Z6A7_9HYPH